MDDEPGLPPVEGDVTIDKGVLRAVLDACTGTLDFGSGFLCDDEVLALRAAAILIGVDPRLVTPTNFACKYDPPHEWQWTDDSYYSGPPKDRWRCVRCGETADEQPEGWERPGWWKPVAERKVLRVERHRIHATSYQYLNGEPITHVDVQILEPLERPSA